MNQLLYFPFRWTVHPLGMDEFAESWLLNYKDHYQPVGLAQSLNMKIVNFPQWPNVILTPFRIFKDKNKQGHVLLTNTKQEVEAHMQTREHIKMQLRHNSFAMSVIKVSSKEHFIYFYYDFGIVLPSTEE